MTRGMRPAEGHSSTPGFTLIEILVALAILAVILAVFAQVLSGSVLSARRIDAETQALLVARSTMERIGRDLPLQPGATSGKLAGGGRWSLRISPATVAGRPAANLTGVTTYLVVLTVTTPPFSPITLTSLRIVPLPAAVPEPTL
jgi:general secretion pathway protein I